MSTVDPTSIKFIEIFPPVGIARVGDSDKYFLAPEIPGVTEPPAGHEKFRDDEQKIKRQAVRFRAYAYKDNGDVIAEINNNTKDSSDSTKTYSLKWTVHVANKKASYKLFHGRHRDDTRGLRNPDVPLSSTDTDTLNRQNLIVDPREKSFDRDTLDSDMPIKLQGQFYGSQVNAKTITLGELRRDNEGRLIFVGGKGQSQCVADGDKPTPEIISEFDSIDWIDDICDGWVNVEVKVDNHAPWVAAHKASVLSAPPKFAWGIQAPTTLYDIMNDIYHTSKETVFYRDIWPVLSGTYALSWVNNKAFQGHGPGGKGNFLPLKTNLATPPSDPLTDADRDNAKLRQQIFDRLRKPNYNTDPDFNGKDEQATTKFMPRLSGDNGDAIEPGDIYNRDRPNRRFAALTQLQYKDFEQWKDGNFTRGPEQVTIGDFNREVENQPEYLTRAILEQTIGDPLYPGMEMWWIAKNANTYIPVASDGKQESTSGSDAQKAAKPPFRIDYRPEKIQPGHLSRGLSLPWQSDFDLCDTHWWPSIRPDDVITKTSFDAGASGNGVTAEANKEKLLLALTKRKVWKRGLRTTQNFTSYPGSTDMVKYWNYLGFVKKVTPTPTGIDPLYLESERRQLPVPVVVAGRPIDG